MAKSATNTNAAFDVKPSEFISLCTAILEAGKVPFVLGPPGLGKSTMVAAIASAAKRRLRDIRLAYYSPTDIGGMPHLCRETGKMKFAPMGLLPTEPGEMVFFDEFPLAPRATQNAALQLILDGRVGEHELPANTWMVLAGNRSEDRCFGERLSPAMVNRVVVIRLKPDLGDWVNWALDAEVDNRIIGYVNFNPASLLDFNPTEWDGEGNFASPRGWEATHRLLNSPSFKSISRDLRRVLVVGALGHAVGNEFAGFLDVYEDLPSIGSVLMDPDKAPLPVEVSAKIAAAAMCANHADKKTLGPIMQYLARFEKMYEVFAVKAIFSRDKSLASSAEFIRWVAGNKNVFQS